jgi:hypothetical protein
MHKLAECLCRQSLRKRLGAVLLDQRKQGQALLQPQGQHRPIKLVIVNQHQHQRNERGQAKSPHNPPKRRNKELPNQKTFRNRSLKKVMIFRF